MEKRRDNWTYFGVSRLLAVNIFNILNVTYNMAAVMWPLATSTVETCYYHDTCHSSWHTFRLRSMEQHPKQQRRGDKRRTWSEAKVAQSTQGRETIVGEVGRQILQGWLDILQYTYKQTDRHTDTDTRERNNRTSRERDAVGMTRHIPTHLHTQGDKTNCQPLK